jgi:cation transport regulator
MTESEVTVPQTVRDVLPEAAQQVYVAAYARSWDEYDAATGNSESTAREAVASRDAWAAVTREFERDPVTFKWHRKGEATEPESAVIAPKHTPLSFLRGLFGRG